MVHPIRGFSAPFSNNNIANIYCDAVLTTTDETYISPLGGIAPVFPSDSGEPIQLVSASAADTDAVRITGLDENFLEQEEIVVMTGLTPVVSTKSFTRINGLTWLGTSAFQGQILAQKVGGSVNFRSLSVDAQLSEDGVYSVPADKKWQVPLIYAAIIRDVFLATTGVSVNIYFRRVGFAFQRPFKFALSASGDTSSSYENLYPLELEGPADFYLSAVATDTATEVVARLTITMRQQ